MKFLKRNLSVIIVCVLEILIGVLLLVNPKSFTAGIIMAVGIALVVRGIFCVIDYFRDNPVSASLTGSLVKGLAFLIGGIVLITCTRRITRVLNSAFGILAVIYGVVILLAGLYKLQWFADSLRLKSGHGRWIFHLINALLSIIFAVVILLNPFSAVDVMWMFIGISLIVSAVCDLCVLVTGGKSTDMSDAS